jgi:hypothetical protein
VKLAKFNLEDVRKLIKNVEKHSFSKTRAMDCVISHLQITISEAKSFILKEISNLTELNFSDRCLIDRTVYDVYGKKIRSIPWYIKFTICEDDNGRFLYSISFHPTESELKTNSETLEKYYQ